MADTQSVTTEQQPLVEFTINGKKVSASRESSLLEALRDNGYDIPHLCHHWALKPYGACRLCLVEVKKGRKTKLTTSCNYPVLEGIEVTTDSDKIRRNRRMMMQLILARAPQSKEIQKMALERFGLTLNDLPFDAQHDGDNCILCGLCVRVCREVVGVEALSFSGRGTSKEATAPFHDIAQSCIGCGACVYVCPTSCIGFEQLPTQRSLRRWNRKLPMRTCSRCGYAYAPIFQLAHFEKIIKKTTSTPDEWFDLCPDCRPAPQA